LWNKNQSKIDVDILREVFILHTDTLFINEHMFKKLKNEVDMYVVGIGQVALFLSSYFSIYKKPQ